MGLLQRLFNRNEPPTETRAAVDTGDLLPFSGFHLFGFGGTVEDVGVEVTPETALAASSVFAGVSIIASTIAGLPLHVHDRQDGGKVYDHPLAKLIRDPNPYMTSFSLWETLVVDIITRGNLYGYIERQDGDAVALYPLPAASTAPKRQNGELLYGVMGLGTGHTLRADEVLHVPHMPLNGIVGRSPLMIARQSIGLSLALERFVGKFFANGCHLQGIMELPQMDKKAREQFAAQLRDYYTGVNNAWRMAVPAVPGAKWHQTTADAEKSQMMAARVHQVREVARVLRIPPHLLADLEKSSYSSIEAQGREFVQFCIQPWTLRIEAELNRKLLREDEKDRYELRFNFDALLRPDTTARYAAHVQACGGPFLSVNEVRRMEGRPPVTGGDSVLSPLNQTPTDKRSEPQKPQASAVFTLIEDAARRLVTKERNAVTRAAAKFNGDAAGFKRWAQGFYTEHANLATRTYTPAAAFLPRNRKAAYVADHHIHEQQAVLLAAIDGGNIDALLVRWEADRAGELAQALLDEEI